MLSERDISNPTSISEQDCSHAVSHDLVLLDPKAFRIRGSPALRVCPRASPPCSKGLPYVQAEPSAPQFAVVAFCYALPLRHGVWLQIPNPFWYVHSQELTHHCLPCAAQPCFLQWGWGCHGQNPTKQLWHSPHQPHVFSASRCKQIKPEHADTRGSPWETSSTFHPSIFTSEGMVSEELLQPVITWL